MTIRKKAKWICILPRNENNNRDKNHTQFDLLNEPASVNLILGSIEED